MNRGTWHDNYCCGRVVKGTHVTQGAHSLQEISCAKFFHHEFHRDVCIQDALEDRKVTAMNFAELTQLDNKAEGHQLVTAACRQHCTVLPDLSAL